jgi:hypothetical protein
VALFKVDTLVVVILSSGKSTKTTQLCKRVESTSYTFFLSLLSFVDCPLYNERRRRKGVMLISLEKSRAEQSREREKNSRLPLLKAKKNT